MEHARGPSFSLNGEPRLNAQVRTTHERNTASLPQPSARRANDTSLSAFAHTFVNCILGFDQQLLTHRNSCLLLTANLALLREQMVTDGSRAWTETAQHQNCKDTNSPSTTMGAHMSSKICSERRTLKKHVTNRL